MVWLPARSRIIVVNCAFASSENPPTDSKLFAAMPNIICPLSGILEISISPPQLINSPSSNLVWGWRAPPISVASSVGIGVFIKIESLDAFQ